LYSHQFYVLSSSTLQEIATAESDRVAVVASQYIFGSVGTLLIGDHYDIDLACNNGLIMAGARVYYNGARWSQSSAAK
jgi:APA family basic amino acid/polyamine antiporter